MKTFKTLGAAVMVLLAILAATAFAPAHKTGKANAKPAAAAKVIAVHLNNAEECKQCGVSNATITEYLVNCSHHHTVYWVQDIAGTCNSQAGIEGCGVATVYVSNGAVIGHQDASGYCN